MEFEGRSVLQGSQLEIKQPTEEGTLWAAPGNRVTSYLTLVTTMSLDHLAFSVERARIIVLLKKRMKQYLELSKRAEHANDIKLHHVYGDFALSVAEMIREIRDTRQS